MAATVNSWTSEKGDLLGRVESSSFFLNKEGQMPGSSALVQAFLAQILLGGGGTSLNSLSA